MRKVVTSLAAVAAMSFCLNFASAASQEITGVLIDSHCAKKMMKKEDPQKAAEAHPASCANDCVKDGATVVLISGKHELKLDKDGEKMAKEYLKSHKDLKVVVTGEKDNNVLKVESIKPVPSKG